MSASTTNRSVGILGTVLLGVGLIAGGAFALMFVRIYFGGISLVDNVLPIASNSTLYNIWTNTIEPALTTFLTIAAAVMQITGIAVLIRVLWSMLPFSR